MTVRIVAALENLENLKAQRDALEAMRTAIQNGNQATLIVADHPGGISVSTQIAGQLVNARLGPINTQIEALQTKLDALAQQL